MECRCQFVYGVGALSHQVKTLLNYLVLLVENLRSGDVNGVDYLGDHINVQNVGL